jgi:hypothetical protein
VIDYRPPRTQQNLLPKAECPATAVRSFSAADGAWASAKDKMSFRHGRVWLPRMAVDLSPIGLPRSSSGSDLYSQQSFQESIPFLPSTSDRFSASPAPVGVTD